ncbi:MAG: T9SS type A sorting domain-containing protein [Bacteroidetes bacterium]|nr:T9SS type A sorting domain-containing protein [Bacteroidota bacterium]MBU1116368.1 T9SS type A sorting domain-containing protein [Bacteroidota bacterium]MBU1800392.1 T9SS type A sorting domain-containing protein [Bacteroidota bacterium]
MFPNGLANGKVLSLGFPFETIYPEETRIALMSEIIKYFNSISDINDSENSGIITEYKLEQNYPNPFNPTTTIRYSIPNNLGTIQNLPLQNVKLTIYDILGREVTTLVNEAQKSGNYEVTFDASNLASGVYLYRLQSTTSSNSGKDFFDTKKMILLK